MVRVEFNVAEADIESVASEDGKRVLTTLTDVDNSSNKLFIVFDRHEAGKLRDKLTEALRSVRSRKTDDSESNA